MLETLVGESNKNFFSPGPDIIEQDGKKMEEDRRNPRAKKKYPARLNQSLPILLRKQKENKSI